MYRTHSERPRVIHDTACGVWQVPKQRCDVSNANGPAAQMVYCSAVEPMFGTIGAILGQMALMVLLVSPRSVSNTTANAITLREMLDALDALESELKGLIVPHASQLHHWVLLKVIDSLQFCGTQLSVTTGLVDARSNGALSEMSRRLTSAHKMLRQAELPQIGLVAVDLTQACCNCSHDKPGAAASPIS